MADVSFRMDDALKRQTEAILEQPGFKHGHGDDRVRKNNCPGAAAASGFGH